MDENTLGGRIARARKEMKLTQTQLGHKFGITDKAVSKWERNLSQPDEKIFPELVEFLGLPHEILSTAQLRTPSAQTTKNRATESRRPVLLDVLAHEFCRILCVSVMVAAVVCFGAGFLGTGQAFAMLGSAATIFAFLTVCRA